MTQTPFEQTHTAPAAAISSAEPGVVQHYRDPALEARDVRNIGGFIHLANWGALRFEGKDALRFVHGQVTNDIQGLAEGRGCHACVLTNKGRIIGDLFLYRTGRDLHGFCGPRSLSGPSQAPLLIETMVRYKVADRVKLLDATGETGLIGLYGPNTENLLRKVFVGSAPLGEGYSLNAGRIGEHESHLFRAPSCPAATEILSVRAEALPEVWKTLSLAASELGMQPFGVEAADLLRIEDGLPIFGVDFDIENFPGEAGLEHTVNYKKGCYIGQETIARVKYLGHFNKFLSGLAPEASVIAGDEIRAGDAVIGKVTSAAHSPALDRPIALGYVKRGHEETGSKVVIMSGGNLVPATVVETPFMRQGN